LKEAAKAPTQSGVSSLFIALKSITDWRRTKNEA
jgi:hypothetical protein